MNSQHPTIIFHPSHFYPSESSRHPFLFIPSFFCSSQSSMHPNHPVLLYSSISLSQHPRLFLSIPIIHPSKSSRFTFIPAFQHFFSSHLFLFIPIIRPSESSRHPFLFIPSFFIHPNHPSIQIIPFYFYPSIPAFLSFHPNHPSIRIIPFFLFQHFYHFIPL